MKGLLFSLIWIAWISQLLAQDNQNVFLGKVSYVSAQNIYVRFDGANQVQEGDTVFIQHKDKMEALLIVESRSSLSAMGKPFPGMEVTVGEEVFVHGADVIKIEVQEPEKTVVENRNNKPEDIKKPKEPEESPFKENIKGRVSVSSYSGFSNETAHDYNRMRYSFSLKADNIDNSRFSADAYFNFSHQLDDWSAVQDNIFNALKIYSLAIRYQPTEQSSIWLGRKINPNLSNIGAMDGAQFETWFKNFSVGAAVGFRPDYGDYSFNSNLLEYGVYFAHEYQSLVGSVRSSLAFFEQRNKDKIDRRFIYFQHSNTLLKDLFFFVSSELDLYKLENDIPTNTLSLTSFYISLRYRIIKQLSVYASYDARKNVIYFETFKSLADRLLEEATRQGVQFRVNGRPAKNMSVGLNASYRIREGDERATKTLRGYVSLNSIPGLQASASLSANLLQTAYLDGGIYGLMLYKDLLNGKLYSSLGYRYVDYRFINATSMKQHVAEIDLAWRINKKWSLSASYEGSVEKKALFNTLYLNLVKRF